MTAPKKDAVRGRPAIYPNPEDLQSKVDEYFSKGCYCEKFIGGKMKELPIPTVAGLAVYLGFTRQSLHNQKQRGSEFLDVVEMAISRIEMIHEENLALPISSSGSQFWLRHNTKAYEEKDTNVNLNVSRFECENEDA